MRDPRYRAAQYADRDQLAWPMYAGQNEAYASPWGHPMAPSPTWQHPTQLSPGVHWGPHQWDYERAAWQGGSPRPQPLAWEHANGWLAHRGQPHHGPQPLGLRFVGSRRGPLRPAPAEPIERQAPPSRGSEQPQQETQDQPPPRSGVPHPLPPGPKTQSHEALPLRRSPAIPATSTQQCVH